MEALKKSTSEVGHAKNITAFQELIAICKGFGATYNPVKESLKITELEKLLTTTTEKFNQFKTQKTAFDLATQQRKETFADIRPLTTKVSNAFAVSGADANAVAALKNTAKKLHGTTTNKVIDKTSTKSTEPAPNKISTSQQSYDRLADHFANIIVALEAQPIYKPNEEELKLTTLKQKLEDLQAKNTALLTAYTAYTNARIERDQALYNPLTGLVQTAKEVKLYVKSVFGTTSPQYKQLSGLAFKIQKSN